jgi:hypothetical protein
MALEAAEKFDWSTDWYQGLILEAAEKFDWSTDSYQGMTSVMP